MNRLVRTVAVMAILMGQLATSSQTLALGDCHEMASGHESSGTAHAPHAHHSSTDRSEDVEEPEADTARCHCAGSFHCGQLAALVANPVSGTDAPAVGSPYPTALLQRPMLAHRRELDRPPA